MKARNKCIHCKKKFKRKFERKILQKKPYDGNMICYRVKKEPVVASTYIGRAYSDEPIKNIYKPGEFTYDYILWDGESHWDFWKPFCSKECAARYAIKKFA